MQADWQSRKADDDAEEIDHDAIEYQGNYVEELIAETVYPRFDGEGAHEAVFQWKKHKKKAIMSIRDSGYVSPLTGTMAALPPTPGISAIQRLLATEQLPLGRRAGRIPGLPRTGGDHGSASPAQV